MEEALLLMNDANVINDDLFLLHDANRPRNVHTGLPYWKYERFSLEDMRDDECEVEFRFKKDDIYNLGHTFGLPEVYRCYNGVMCKYFCVDFKNMFFTYCQETLIVEERLLSRDSYCRGTFTIEGQLLSRNVYCQGTLFAKRHLLSRRAIVEGRFG